MRTALSISLLVALSSANPSEPLLKDLLLKQSQGPIIEVPSNFEFSGEAFRLSKDWASMEPMQYFVTYRVDATKNRVFI